MYDTVIIGGGPGGIAAGVYAARKKIKSALITDNFGGQSLVSADIQNWIGTKSVSGFEFAQMLEEHLRAQEGINIIYPDLVEKVEKSERGFNVTTKKGEKLETKTVLVTTGSRRKKLGIPGEKEFDGKGVAYCSTCDAPIFKDKIIAVIGGAGALFYFLTKNALGRRIFCYVMSHAPLLKRINRDLSVQRFSSTFSSLMRAGLPIVDALKLTAALALGALAVEVLSRLALRAAARLADRSAALGAPLPLRHGLRRLAGGGDVVPGE